jgi:hypothetical protein
MIQRARLVGLLIVVSIAPLAAQAGPFIPLDDPLLPLFEHLVTRGVVADPTPFVRPIRQAAALASLRDARDPASADSAIIARLTRAWDPGATSDRWELSGRMGAQGYGPARRQPMQPAGESGGGLFGEVSGRLVVGPVTVATRVQGERRLLADPDWPGRDEAAGKNLAFRAADAYASVALGRGAITLGTLDRNWGPAMQDGLGVSAAAYPRPAFTLELPTSPVGGWFTFAPLPSESAPDGALVERYFASHRIAIRPRANLEIALWETTILADVADQGTEALGTLFGVMTFAAQFGRQPNTNTILGIDLRWRPRGGLQFEAQFAGDDIRLLGDNQAAGEQPRPDRWAATLGARGRLPGGMSFETNYERVTALAYRTANPLENYTADGIGLTRLVPDYDRATFRINLPLQGKVLISPSISMQRQGEGRLDQPVDFSPNTPTFLIGGVERSIRGAVAIAGAAHGLSIRSDAGITASSGGVTRFTGRVVFTLHLSASGPLQ